MRIETALRQRDAAIQALRSIWAYGESFGLPSERIQTDDLAVRARLLKKAPQWVRSYVDGYARALRDRAYDSGALVFGGFYEGRFYSTQSSRPDYYGKHGIEAADYADDGRVTGRGHYWRGDGSKPFYVSDEPAKREA